MIGIMAAVVAWIAFWMIYPIAARHRQTDLHAGGEKTAAPTCAPAAAARTAGEALGSAVTPVPPN